MIIKFLLTSTVALFLFSCSKDNSHSLNSGSVVFRTVNTLSNPLSGVKVVLLESESSNAHVIRKDSGLTNLSGYISFNLIEGKAYRPTGTLDCLTTSFIPNILILEYHPNLHDSIMVYLGPIGYLNVINTSPNIITVWSKSVPHDIQFPITIPANENRIIPHPASLDSIFWAKWNTVTYNYVQPIFDTAVLVTCNDTTAVIVHL